MISSQMIRGLCSLLFFGFSAPLLALNAFSNHYYLEIGAGSKQINPANQSEELTSARVGKIGLFTHFAQNFGLGATVSLLEFGSPDSPIGSSYARGSEVGLHARALTPTFQFWDTKLRGFLAVGGTVDSNNRRKMMTEEGEESLRLTNQRQSTQIVEKFRSIGPSAAIGVKWDVADHFGFQAELGVGREKWISEKAIVNGKQKEYDKLQERLDTQQFVVGVSFIN